MKEQTMSTIQYDMLYLLSCGVNKTKPQQNILEQYKSDDRKLMQLYRFSKQHFVEALTGTVLKQVGVTLPDPWEKDMMRNEHGSFLLWSRGESGICRSKALF